jgi:hypothetical protein
VEPCAQRLRGRHLADADHQIGSLAGEVLAAHEQVVVGDHVRCSVGVRAPAPAGRRFGQHGPTDSLGEVDRHRRVRTSIAAADDQPPLGSRPEVDAAERRPLGRACPWPPIRPAFPIRGVQLFRARRQRLAQREVQVDRTRSAQSRGVVCAAAELAVVNSRLGPGRQVADLDEQLREVPVELDLIDRLTGADLS